LRQFLVDANDGEETAALEAAIAALEAVEQVEQVCGEAYQVAGVLLSDTGQFDTDHGNKILDNLSQMRMVHDDVLPWESVEQAREAPPAAAVER
jgi:hypothetical protein